MARVISLVVSMPGLGLPIILASLWMIRRPASRWARRVLIATTAVFALSTAYLIPFMAVRLIAGASEPLEAGAIPPGPVGIVLLGTGNSEARAWDGTGIPLVDPVTASRVAEAARVFRLVPDAWILSSAGVIDGRTNGRSGGAIMQELLVAAGVPKSRIIVEGSSLNTREEALLVAPMLAAAGVRSVVLVTSAIHMRRALGTFRAVGLEGIPAVARDPLLPMSVNWFVPDGEAITLTRAVVHELAGWLGYKSRGWVR